MICDVSVGVDIKTNDDVEHCKNSDKKKQTKNKTLVWFPSLESIVTKDYDIPRRPVAWEP